MEDFNESVPSVVPVPAVQFESNKEFQKQDLNHERDSALMHFQRKSWMRSRGQETRCNREALTTLLAPQSDNSDECVEKLLAEKISYRDLASLTHTDLELMSFKSYKEREELLNFFAELPNQDPTYDNICKLPEAQNYNSKMINTATSHLEGMRSALAAVNYKLQIMPPQDVLVGDKFFASRFVLDALDELEGVTDEIDNELEKIAQLIGKGDQFVKKDHNKSKKSKTSKNCSSAAVTWIVVSSVATGVLAVVLLLKFNRLA